MLSYDDFFERLALHDLAKHHAHFAQHITQAMSPTRHGDLEHWYQALADLPDLSQSLDVKDTVAVGCDTIDSATRAHIDVALRALIPWRKGPYEVCGIHIDTEWRSDFKWSRVAPHLSPLEGRKVLDIGCGSGYHCWRMYGAGAAWVVGIDPSPRFVVQHRMISHFAPPSPIDVLPLGIEHLPARLNAFDTVFSMGVLYHRSAPFDHLKELRDTIRPGGELVLETLVIEGHEGEVLVPRDRYAQMRNVWFIPSVKALTFWLEKVGFEAVRCVDLNQTSMEEQRTTEWMPSHSLANFLDPDDHNRTIEGYPAPLRAVMIAKRPEAGKKRRHTA